MKMPWVSRLRLELAEERIAERDAQIAELKAANDKALEAIEAAKDATRTAEKERDQLATRPSRLLGSQIRQMATKDATQRAKENGKVH